MIDSFLLWWKDLTLKDAATLIVLAAAVVTALGVLRVKVWAPLVLHLRFLRKLPEMFGGLLDEKGEPVNMAALSRDVQVIKSDLHPNGGSSLRDAIDRIEVKVISAERISWAMNRDATTGIFKCTSEGKNLEVNRTYCRWLEASTEELLEFGWRKFLTGASAREGYDQEWKSAFKDGRELEFRIDFKTTSGVVKHFQVHTYPLHDKTGQAHQYLGVLTPLAVAGVPLCAD
jgi:PAS domain-containing protein